MPVELRRLDPTRNMRRFYRLDVQPDLSGDFLLLKQWGRIGAGGRIKVQRYDAELLPSTPCSGRPSASGGAGTGRFFLHLNYAPKTPLRIKGKQFRHKC